MESSASLIENAQSIRARLRRPQNAVEDTGIDLKRLPRGFELSERKPLIPPVQIIKIDHATEAHDIPVRAPAAKLSAFFQSKLIIDMVATAHDLNAEALKSAVRTARLVKPRQLAMYFLRTLVKPERSLPWIGRQFGDRDHTTVIWAIHRVKTRIDSDLLCAANIAALETKIRTAIGAQ